MLGAEMKMASFSQRPRQPAGPRLSPPPRTSAKWQWQGATADVVAVLKGFQGQSQIGAVP